MLHPKSGIPRFILKRNGDAGGSKPSNERNDCAATIRTDSLKTDTSRRDRPTICADRPTVKTVTIRTDRPTIRTDRPTLRTDTIRSDRPTLKTDDISTDAISTDRPTVKTDAISTDTIKTDRPTLKTDTIRKDTLVKYSSITANNSEHITSCSETSIAKMSHGTSITTGSTTTGRHWVTSSKSDSQPTNLEVIEGSYSESETQPAIRRTFIIASRAKTVAVGASTDVKGTDCKLRSLVGGLQVVSNLKSRYSMKTVPMPTVSSQQQPNPTSYNLDRQNGDHKSENGSEECCQSVIHEAAQSEAQSLNKFLQLFIGETEALAESLSK